MGSSIVFFFLTVALLAFGKPNNPILPGWNPDPSIVRVGEDYFIVTSTFEYYPGHPIYHSKNLVDWTLIGHGLNRPSQLGLYGTPSDAGVWAPSLRYHDGTFYLTSTKRYVYTSELRLFPRSFYVKTKDIFSNDWSDPVYFDSLGYDVDLFWDTNGDFASLPDWSFQVYLTWSGINNNHDKIYSVWAPSLRYHDGTFYLTSTKRYVYTSELRLFPRSFYVKTKDIFSNDWSDPVYFDSLGYDVDLFWDTNGDVYLTWSGINNNHDKIYSIWQSKIDLETGTSLTPAQIIFNGTLTHDAAARPEGPHIYHINSTYYLLIAEGGTGIPHRATIQRSSVNPSGPWENNPNNPILFNGANTNLSVQNTGHADIVQAVDGKWWGVALGVRPQGTFDDSLRLNREQLGRETFLSPVDWIDGWPVFNNDQPLSEEVLSHDDVNVTSPSSAPASDDSARKSDAAYFNDFTSRSLDNTFYTLRTPYAPFHSFTSSSLQLRPNAYAPGDRDSPAMFLRKQTAHNETFETELHFPSPRTNLEEAGIGILYGDMLHNEVGVSGPPEGQTGRFVVVRTVTLNKQTNYMPLSSTTGPVKLRVQATPLEYALSFSEGSSGQWTEVARFDGSVLCIPPAGGFFFKGAAFSMYNTGNGKPSLTKAEFAYWKQG
ncbi:Beta-xylosidase [Leucoagaricus sp. SymC.cos]|nr:Beta-xylosidase [Leucoagaricus sp. SymC.cos]